MHFNELPGQLKPLNWEHIYLSNTLVFKGPKTTGFT